MYEYKIHEVLRVVDGDTLDVIVDLGFGVLKKIRIRISGIDSPENKNMREYKGTFLKEIGDAATKFVIEILSYEEDYIYLSKGYEGKYGRSVGDIKFTNGKLLSEILIEERLAVPYTNNDEIKLASLMQLHEYHKHAYED